MMMFESMRKIRIPSRSITMMIVTIISFWMLCFIANSKVSGWSTSHRSYSKPDFIFSPEYSTKIEEIQTKGENLRQRICKLTNDEARDLNEKIHECNQLNHIHKIEELLKPCRKLKITQADLYLEFERIDCQFEECQMKVMNSPEYSQIMHELERLKPEERLENDHKRFTCAMEALGVKPNQSE
ncbi:hypothetical protein SSS_09806 [Sarcoptes scabiei]|uniref:Uncharacterized protein n=1 Tax=Sarcoptes scabiei TaxID=52283 RepID=A0A834RF01_SARSC|nr:hypothetical protein SSS_09806 [Sarcoptes scabiei]